MDNLLLGVLLAACVCAAVAQHGYYDTTTTPRPYNWHPPAPVHYVAIGKKLDGDYKFGYDTGKGPLGQSFREESRLPDGTVKGAYGYVDANGKQRIIRYTAGKHGFSAEGDLGPDGAPRSSTQQQAPVAPQQQYQQQAPSTYRAAIPVHRPQQERQQRYRYQDEDYGPAVIDTSLLSYNIGVSHQG